MHYTKTMLTIGLLLLLAISPPALAEASNSNVVKLKSEFFEIHVNCDARGFQYFAYTLDKDVGSLPRYKPFHKDLRLPKNCQQSRTSTSRLPKGSPIQFDRGHGVSSNAMDDSLEAMKLTNAFSNIVPQASKLNRSGAWREIEILEECYREFGRGIKVFGGALYETVSNDFFMISHGVKTPDRFWKIILFADNEVQAWLMPNTNKPIKAQIDRYLVAPAEIENITGYRFADIPADQKIEKDTASKRRTQNCNYS